MCDANNMTKDVVIEIGNVLAEDAVWLREKDDCNHSNIAELDTMLKSINLTLKWEVKEVEIRIDLAVEPI